MSGTKIIDSAKSIIKNIGLRCDMKEILDSTTEELKDIILILVTPSMEVDSYWTNLSNKEIHKVLTALKGGIPE